MIACMQLAFESREDQKLNAHKGDDMTQKATWTPEAPTEPGYYWFYGWAFRDRDRPPKHHLVDVRKTMNSFCYITNGHFLYPRAEGGYGKWLPAELPDPPQLPEETE